MEILQGVQYHYTSAGKQDGPVEGSELVGLAEQGYILAEDRIWTEGMADWLPARLFRQLAPLYAPEEKPILLRHESGGLPGMIKVPADQMPHRRHRKGANFSLLMMFLFLGVFLYGGALLLAGFNQEGLEPEAEVSFPVRIAVCAMFSAPVFFLLYCIYSLIYLYRGWAHIQELPVARTTPGKAIGFLFIPFFNIYWFFIAYYGWAEDFNKYLDAAGAHHVPRASPALALTFCILSLLSFPLLHPFVMWDVCKGVNRIATLPDPNR